MKELMKLRNKLWHSVIDTAAASIKDEKWPVIYNSIRRPIDNSVLPVAIMVKRSLMGGS